MKKILVVFICGFMLFSLMACGRTEPISEEISTEALATYEPVPMEVACIKGPTGVGMVKLMEDAETGNAKNDYVFTVASSADEISAKIVSGDINIASVPTNLAVKLYNKTEGKIRMLAVNTLGVLSIIENGNSISSFADLKGKTIYSTGEGSNPEYILKYLLEQNELIVGEDVQIQFVATNDELIAQLVSGNAEVAMVPEPAATTVLTNSESLNRVLSINDEWKKVQGEGLMMGCIVALDTFVEENKVAVDMFLQEYEASIHYVKENKTDAAALCEKYKIIPAAKIAEKAIPECNLTFVTGKKMQEQIAPYFKVLMEFDPTAIGGKLPENDFFYGMK
ncbi:MAG: PhnD/SsuA/transferrin family substrate-binding protein [Lachnospiraceae bacterium]|nr:PhnD/SsuA/transferrin family substrate-binding protein [Lachnospiraceae bacterium]